MTARGRQNASETRAARRAERTRAGQNAEWSGSTSTARVQRRAPSSPFMHPWSCTLLHLKGFREKERPTLSLEKEIHE
ncbi:hypothetical protein CHARACLAT_007614 [Characodon lateralis]|uniref:Uncharacterized protein n=1 Tax=Characodon lateralis TaxID=208331 RepID=A0ABU7E071_9TELE|nr:hypothetical protein [Characodon lateralis]